MVRRKSDWLDTTDFRHRSPPGSFTLEEGGFFTEHERGGGGSVPDTIESSSAKLQYTAGLIEEAAGKLAIDMDERHLRIAEGNRALAEMGEELDRRLDELEKRFAAI